MYTVRNQIYFLVFLMAEANDALSDLFTVECMNDDESFIKKANLKLDLLWSDEDRKADYLHLARRADVHLEFTRQVEIYHKILHDNPSLALLNPNL
jgi:hypothetical protein